MNDERRFNCIFSASSFSIAYWRFCYLPIIERMNNAHIYLHARLDIDRNSAIRIGRASQFVLLGVEV